MNEHNKDALAEKLAEVWNWFVRENMGHILLPLYHAHII